MDRYRNRRNPILPLQHHVPDGEAHVMPDGRLYIYGSYDNREDEYCSEEYHVVSTSDLENWTVHGVSLKGRDIPWFDNPNAPKYPGIDWSHPTPFIRKMLADQAHAGDKEKFESQREGSKPPLLFAPDAAYRDGKYYLYFCMEDDSEGVAVSESPQGPFQNPIQLPCGGIDPAVFIDDDGQAYYYWGQLYSHGVRLNPDMVSFDRSQIVDNLVGEPFGPGERIMGYQACGLKGSLYMDVDEGYGEKLTHISDGDEAVFRYVKSSQGWNGLTLFCRGTGRIEVYYDEILAGAADIQNRPGECVPVFLEFDRDICWKEKEYELKLTFARAEALEVLKLVLS